MWRPTFNCIVWLACFALLAACNRSEVQGKVFGQVTLDGQPLTAGLVVFSNAARGVYMTAKLQADGRYELQTAQGWGLPLGDYRIAVSPPLVEPTMPGAPPPKTSVSDIPAKYLQPETSGLALTVTAGENPFDIALRR